MSFKNRSLSDCLMNRIPDATLLLANTPIETHSKGNLVLQFNSMAQTLFPSLTLDAPPPIELESILKQLSPPAITQVTLSKELYQVALEETLEGTLVIFRSPNAQDFVPKFTQVAKQIRNDCSGIVNALQSLYEQGNTSPEKAYHLACASQSSYRLRWIADQLEFHDNIDESLSDHNYKDIITLCRSLSWEVEDVFRQSKWNYSFQTECNTLCTILNERLIRRMIYALISNAVLSMPKGGSFGLKVGQTKTHILLTIWDEGEGHNAPGELFLPSGNQSNQSNQLNPRQGLGIGLFSVRKIVALHKGSIMFEARKIKGLQCHILLPIINQADEDNIVMKDIGKMDEEAGFAFVLTALSNALPWESYVLGLQEDF